MWYPLSYAVQLVIGNIFQVFTLIVLFFILIQLSKIANSKRLSSILTIKLKDGLKIEDFEPQKKILEAKMLENIETENHPDPSTWAYCVLEHSGFNLFIENKKSLEIQKALGRLRVNNDQTKINDFIKTIIENL